MVIRANDAAIQRYNSVTVLQMKFIDRITDRIAEKAAKRGFEVGLETLNDLMKDEEKRNALLAPVWDYFDKRINLKIANLTSGQEKLEGLPSGMGIPGGLGALAGMLPPGLAQFAPLLGMLGGGGGSASPVLPAPSNGHSPGMRR